ncbi:serine hydrolase domain-containing protein [Paenibacillus aurantiacus]|uniref:Serine hydrolase domain-containing protein n=1 Tax=Paenibacillus aurantiacus TaxID=1936118 RepID=A0ABV5KUE4_9BACL
MEAFVEEQRLKGKIPGLAVVVVEKDRIVYQRGFGYADLKRRIPVTANTLFELGSNTKAFTALAILQLEKQGRLRLDDDVRTYIPWLILTYQGKSQPVTLRQLLHHTSGIASNTIARIPPSRANDALVRTVKTLAERPLHRMPGSAYEYATINYDVLGLVLETVTKKPYEDYIQQFILTPIGMDASMVGQPAQSVGMASGYKIGLTRAIAYTPPVYRGNTPAGYLISNANDIAKWLNVQLGTAPGRPIDPRLIAASHIPDKSVKPFAANSTYAYGWSIEQKNGRAFVLHAGENPTFSSYIIMQPEQGIGIAVMANMRTTATTAIGEGLMALWQGWPADTNHFDPYQKLDQFVTVVWMVMTGTGIVLLALLLKLVRNLAGKRKQRRWASRSGKRVLLLILHIILAATGLTGVIALPQLLLGGLPWSFILVWAPTSITLSVYTCLAVMAVYFGWGMLLIMTKKSQAR